MKSLVVSPKRAVSPSSFAKFLQEPLNAMALQILVVATNKQGQRLNVPFPLGLPDAASNNINNLVLDS